MRACDYIAAELYNKGVRHVYGLMGGGASGLNDGFIKNGKIKYVTFHNEQGAGHAAVGEAKLTGNISVVNPTTGCGGTNCMTSLLGAWQDSVPVVFISGNVGSAQCSRPYNVNRGFQLRKFGIQEHDIIETVKSMTKYAVFVDDVNNVAHELDKAIDIATSGRKGPVWLDIPSDVQTALMPSTYEKYKKQIEDDYSHMYEPVIKDALVDMKNSSRPIILAGQGIKQSNTVKEFVSFIEKYNVPFVSTYGARDLVSYNHPLNIGAIGIKGSRAGNFAMQASNFLLSLGCSLNNSHTGYDVKTWSPLSVKYIVNLDYYDIEKYTTQKTWGCGLVPNPQIFPFNPIYCRLEDFFTISGYLDK